MGQIEADSCRRAVLVEPGKADLVEWAKSCCLLDAFSREWSPFSGLSPGRSIVVVVYQTDGTLETFYYKLFDDGLVDVDEHPDALGVMLPTSRHWWRTWNRLLRLILHFELRQRVVVALASCGGAVGVQHDIRRSRFFCVPLLSGHVSSVHPPCVS